MTTPADLAALKMRLEAATERLNAAIQNAENALAGLHMGVIASVKMESSRPGWSRYLLFEKRSDVWRLVVEDGPDKGEVTSTPLRNCSREVRLTSVEYLPALLEAMRASSEAETERVEEKISELERFAEKVGTIKPETA